MTTGSRPRGWGTEDLRLNREARRQLQEQSAENRDRWIQRNRYYYDRVKRLLRYIVEPGKRVLEVRCQTGHFLDAVSPAYGLGVEISDKLVAIARAKYPHLNFVNCDPEALDLKETFDYILFSHIFDTVDLIGALERLRKCCHSGTRLIVYTYNHLWQPVLEFGSRWGLRAPFIEPNWLTEHDVEGFLRVAGFEVIRTHRRLLFPKWVPLLSSLLNDLVAHLPGIRRLCMAQIMVARLHPVPLDGSRISVSVV